MERKKYMKTRITILAIVMATIMALGLVTMLPRAQAAAPLEAGPRVNQLVTEFFTSGGSAEIPALQSGSIDLVDWALTPSAVSSVEATNATSSNKISLDPFTEFGMMEFDINNNATISTYPNILSPTSAKEFRQALAYMTDKTYIINTFVGGMGVALDTPIMSWLNWADPNLYTDSGVSVPYSYNPAEACLLLNEYGWRSSPYPSVNVPVTFPVKNASEPLSYNWPTVNGGPNVAGQTLASVLNKVNGGSGPGIIFVIRSDDVERMDAGLCLVGGPGTGNPGLQTGGVNNAGIGIPVDEFVEPRATAEATVMYGKDFNLYTGGWSLSRDPTYIYDLWNSAFIDWNPNDFAWNYDNIINSAWDAATNAVNSAPTYAAAQVASRQACDIFYANEFFIPLWAPSGYYANLQPWNVLNVDNFGVQNGFNILAMNNPTIGVTGGTLYWGFGSDIQQLNVIDSEWVWDWQILGEIFDTLMSDNPLNIGVNMPWMASSWTVGSWIPPVGEMGTPTGTACTTVTFTLNPNIYWINPITGTKNSTVTTADVAFSAIYTYAQSGWNLGDIYNCWTNVTGSNAGLPFITTTANTVTFYMNFQSVWSADMLGGLPIIPKIVFEGIPNATGFTPGSTGINVETLMGSGPFYYVSYSTGVNAVLNANRYYFMSIVPNVDTDGMTGFPTQISIPWGLFKSNAAAPWAVNVLDLITVAESLGATGPYGGWIPADVNKDKVVNVLDLILVAADIGANWPLSGQ